MYNDLKKLKSIKGLTDAVKRKIEKAWTWGLITDAQFEELMEMKREGSVDASGVAGSDGVDAVGSGDAGTADEYIEENQYFY